MAAAESVTFVTELPTTEDRHKEPSLTDLREMLVDIQVTENRRRRKRIKSTVNKRQTEIVDLKKQLTKSATQLAAAEKELDEGNPGNGNRNRNSETRTRPGIRNSQIKENKVFKFAKPFLHSFCL